MEIEQNNGLRCGQCNSTQTYLRLKTKEIVCRSCGYIDKIKTPEQEQADKNLSDIAGRDRKNRRIKDLADGCSGRRKKRK